ncbi:hypothetical protein L950_0202945 [Sphingobacterium sp. IITKGP-BTPF85]|nr:hypothetical protein L950_0202945 [Sphingobacterium sp. IITKGP-BTPF85]
MAEQSNRLGYRLCFSCYYRVYGAIPNKNAAILIAGCGNAYEAVYLLENNFTDITLIDFAEEAVKGLIEKFAGYPAIKILCTDFLNTRGNMICCWNKLFLCDCTGKTCRLRAKSIILAETTGSDCWFTF